MKSRQRTRDQTGPPEMREFCAPEQVHTLIDRPTSLSVIVPAYNEQYLIEASLARLRVLAESSDLDRIRVIVVDDASTDQTAAAITRFRESLPAIGLATRMEWIFLHHQKNQGKGAAIRTGLMHVDTELTVIHDADLEYHPQDLLRMVPLFRNEGADAVYGSRFLAGAYRRVLFFRHALGNNLLTLLTNLVCDFNLSDMETCYKMVRTELLRSIPLRSRDFRIEVELTIKLAKRGARLFEVPISYSGRTYAEGKKIGWKDGVRALGAIARFAASDEIFAPDPYGSHIRARLNRAPRFSHWIAETIRPWVGERVLEIGAGNGGITMHLVPRQLYWAAEANPLYRSHLRQLRQTRPYLHVGSIDSATRETFPAGQSFETIVCQNVAERLENNSAALVNFRSALQPGGRAVLIVPQGPGLLCPLDEALGRCRRYTRQELVDAGKQAGFELEALVPFNRLGSAAWWINGRLLRRRRFGLVQVKLLNLLVPLLRRADRWLPLPPLSLIAVFRNPARATPVPASHADSLETIQVSRA